jgi:peptide/nickel transport system ATP-binding protein
VSALLEVEDLHVSFVSPDRTVHAVNGVSFAVGRGETLGILGESGSGKSVTLRSILKLHPEHRTRWSGSIRLLGDEVLTMSKGALADLRGRRVSMIFQEPATAFDPVFTIGYQIAESIRRHTGKSDADAWKRARELLELVHIPSPAQRLKAYPHEMSGGMRQRAMIAMAMSCKPQLLIADEPTTALDVTIQAQILELMQEMKDKIGMSVMLITHAMGVVAETCQRVVVMYAGKVVEEAPVEALFGNPRHPYTQGLIRSIPRVDRAGERKNRLEAIAGTVPSLLDPPAGCRFASRCKHAGEACTLAMPPLKEVGPSHRVACVL